MADISSRLCSFGEFCNSAVGARTVCLEGFACKPAEPLSRQCVGLRPCPGAWRGGRGGFLPARIEPRSLTKPSPCYFQPLTTCYTAIHVLLPYLPHNSELVNGGVSSHCSQSTDRQPPRATSKLTNVSCPGLRFVWTNPTDRGDLRLAGELAAHDRRAQTPEGMQTHPQTPPVAREPRDRREVAKNARTCNPSLNPLGSIPAVTGSNRRLRA